MSNWRRILKAPDIEALQVVADGKAPPSACPICKDVPDDYSVVERADEDEPDPFRGHLKGGFLQRCPTSGALYWVDKKYEYLAGGSEDQYSFERVTPARAATIIAEWASEAPAGGTPRA